MTGFGGHFESEAVEGALPKGRNSPQRPAFGLYSRAIVRNFLHRAAAREQAQLAVSDAANRGPSAVRRAMMAHPCSQRRLRRGFRWRRTGCAGIRRPICPGRGLRRRDGVDARRPRPCGAGRRRRRASLPSVEEQTIGRERLLRRARREQLRALVARERTVIRRRSHPIQPAAPILVARHGEGCARQLLGIQAVGGALGRIAALWQRPSTACVAK